MERFTQLNLPGFEQNTENICEIIKTAAQYGVKTLKFGELEIVYNNINNNVDQMTVTHAENIEPLEVESNTGQPISEDLQKFDDDLVLEQDFENLMLEDPLRYEELLATEKIDEFGSPITQL